MNEKFDIIPAEGEYRTWVDDLIREEWGGPAMVTKGRLIDTSTCPAFVAVAGGEILGAATYHIENGECEVTSLNSLASGKGVGVSLLNAVRAAAEKASCRRLWLVTTNDNAHAIRFYQRFGMTLCAVRLNALNEYRTIKPSIPLLGTDSIPLLHEFEFEIKL